MTSPGTTTLSAERSIARLSSAAEEPPRAPGISVVVSDTHDITVLRACLSKIAPCCAHAGAELIVVRVGHQSEVDELRRDFQSATYVAAPAGSDAGTLRRIGLLHATRNIVAFVDADATERQSWAAELCRNWNDWIAKGVRVAAGSCEVSASSPRPLLSVVMPVHNGAETFPLALDAMALSDLPSTTWELVVVDDASTDETALVAARHADKLVRLPPRRHGPGYARNRGFEVTLGECITFVNADVMVHHDTLRRSIAAVLQQPGVGAIFGSYDTRPVAKGFVSQYRNLLQHYYHQCNAGDAATFSSACGTIRGDVFEEAGGYDEWHFPRHQLEDLELGQRIRRLGHRIVLDCSIQVTHLKRWTLRRFISTEIFDRGLPWMRLVNTHVTPAKRSARSLRSMKQVNIGFTWLGLALALAGWRNHVPALIAGALACVALVITNNRAQLRFFNHVRGTLFAAATVVLDLLYYAVCGVGLVFGWIALQTLGAPGPGPVDEAFSEMSLKRWPPVPVRRVLDIRQAVPTPAQAEPADLPAARMDPVITRDETALGAMVLRQDPETPEQSSP